MTKGTWIAVAAGGLLAVLPATAKAQEQGNVFNRSVAAPSNAFEVGISAGYAQGVGDISNRPGQQIQDFANAGGAVGLELGYRLSPQVMLGVYGQGAQFGSELADSKVRNLQAGVQANFHFAPYSGMDPWVGIGAGYNGLWLVPDTGANSSWQGLQLARVRLGADFRASNEVALGPVIGASANLFLQERLPGDTSFNSVDGRRVNLQFFAGLSGTFDFAGTSVRAPSASMAAR